MILRTETGSLSETNLLKFQLVHEAFYFFLFYVLQNIPHQKKVGNMFVDPKTYATNLLMAYVETLFTRAPTQHSVAHLVPSKLHCCACIPLSNFF